MSPPARRPLRLSRRGLLEAGALAGVGVLLGGCASEREAPSARVEADVVAGLLARERRLIAGLAALAPTLRGDDARHVRRMLAHDRRHAAALAGALRARGREGRAPAPADGTAGALDADALAPVLADKDAAIVAYVDALARVGDPVLRVRLLQIGAVEAEHAGVLRMLMGDDPAPDAFAGVA